MSAAAEAAIILNIRMAGEEWAASQQRLSPPRPRQLRQVVWPTKHGSAELAARSHAIVLPSGCFGDCASELHQRYLAEPSSSIWSCPVMKPPDSSAGRTRRSPAAGKSRPTERHGACRDRLAAGLSGRPTYLDTRPEREVCVTHLGYILATHNIFPNSQPLRVMTAMRQDA